MKALRLRKSTTDVKVVILVFWGIFLACAIVHIFPIFWALINSMKTGEEFFESSLALPQSWHLRNYLNVFKDFRYRNYFYLDLLINSLWQLAVNVFVNVGASVLLAYIVARYRFPGRNALYTMVIFANTIPIIGSGAANFRLMQSLNMINNPALIWIAWATGFDFAFIILYGNFKGISSSYSEAAKIDGANDWTVLLRVIIPQALPCIVAISIQQAIAVWNNYGTVMIYLREYPNLAYGLYLFNTDSNYVENSKPIYFAASIISALPVIVLYSCSQKLILTNVTAGGLKG